MAALILYGNECFCIFLHQTEKISYSSFWIGRHIEFFTFQPLKKHCSIFFSYLASDSAKFVDILNFEIHSIFFLLGMFLFVAPILKLLYRIIMMPLVSFKENSMNKYFIASSVQSLSYRFGKLKD